MFNALRSDELLVGIGQVLRAGADRRGSLEEYDRSQLLSAYSVSRLLAAEQRAAPGLLAWARSALDAALTGPDDELGAAARRRLNAAADGVEIGAVLSDLLGELPTDDPRHARVRSALRELTDREVAALADLPG